MNYVVHLTEGCNLRCKYCYENRYYNKMNNEICFENIKAIVDRESEHASANCFITFYGGEPLLKKELIYKTVEYIKMKKTNTKFYFSMTTNGTLMDEDFVNYMKVNNFIQISYSIDGAETTHNSNRIFKNGKGSFEVVKGNAIRLLKQFKNVIAMMVVTKNNSQELSENIKYLYHLGFRTFNTLFDYFEKWNDQDFVIIKKELKKVAEFYYDVMMRGEDINIPIFDEKIETHINRKFDCNESCLSAMKSVNVGVDGKFYFCMQFVYNSEYVIGDCKNGIDSSLKNNLLAKMGVENEECKDCVIKNRCKHKCPCKNYMITNDVNGLSPVVCEFERLFIEIADDLAGRLYNSKCDRFIKKFYFTEVSGLWFKSER